MTDMNLPPIINDNTSEERELAVAKASATRHKRGTA